MPIRILPSDVSSQISAGEIIERPASVVKEIMENSIDAGAKNINISIEKSGFQSIILNDDGCGIRKQELLLAVTHHATSKINLLSDLEKINTFGFRGEALASIRAVSRLTLISSFSFNYIGWKIYLGDLKQDIIFEPISHPKGTTIIVENLFYNIPVRLKFIKSKKLEFLKICEVVKKIALSHFNINFLLKHNNKIVFKYESVNNKNNKIYRLKDILNTVDLNQFIEIEEKKYNISLFGWISHPYNFKNFKNIQYSYINNRYVYNNVFVNSVRAAYSQIEENRNTSFILYLKISPNNIDINIHPTKNEIKFHAPHLIYKFIYDTILYNLKKIKKKYLLNNTPFKRKNNFYEKNKYNSDNLNSIFNTCISSSFFKKIFLSKDLKIKKNIIISFQIFFLKNILSLLANY